MHNPKTSFPDQNLNRRTTNLFEKNRKSSQNHQNSHKNWYNEEVGGQLRHLSTNSRAEAIARGQWELMEMVRNMPDESSYELSLKDIVEHHRLELAHEAPQTGDVSVNKIQQRAVMVKKIERNVSFDHNKGLFMNMVFPFSLKFKKKRNKSMKVSPKPDGLKGGGGGGGDGGERDLRKNNSDGDSGVGGRDSSRSSDTGDRRKINGFQCCFTIFRPRRSKSAF